MLREDSAHVYCLKYISLEKGHYPPAHKRIIICCNTDEAIKAGVRLVYIIVGCACVCNVYVYIY